MANPDSPFIPAEQNLPEITLRVIILAILLAVVLALSNAFLALKIGMLTSASIPAAVLSMGILRFFKDANILENNLVQTAASAGEAVAGGIVYTIPALVIIGYWQHFDYWENLVIALLGGLLGVMFSIPLRPILMRESSLRFPEGRAIAEVLKSQADKVSGFRDLLFGSLAGAVIELCQTGFKVLANSWEVWFVSSRTIYGFGTGFAPAMIGAGYLIGFRMSLSILLGAIIGWLISVPIVSEIFPVISGGTPVHMVMALWTAKISYIGIGAMLFAGIWTFLTLLKPFYLSLKTSIRAVRSHKLSGEVSIRTEYDIPIHYVTAITILTAIALFFLLNHSFPLSQLAVGSVWHLPIVLASLFYILIVGFVFCAITAYFSGMVGVSASPGSAIIIAGMLMAALLLMTFMNYHHVGGLTQQQMLAAEAVTIIIGAIITGAAAISNDNTQDLKVGHLVGATPWKQQVMLILGVVVSAAVIPPIMQLLFDVYGIAGVMPHPGMDPTQTLPAPPAAVMAALTRAVFHQNLPWGMLGVGGLIVLATIMTNRVLSKKDLALSILGIAIGIYLPLASSTPLFIGGLFAFIVDRNALSKAKKHRGTLIACGLVAGAALMDVVLAIPFSLLHSPDSLRLVNPSWVNMAGLLSLVATISLGTWLYKVTR